MRTIEDLIQELQSISKEDRQKEFTVLQEPYAGVYLCTKEGKGKVKPQIELLDLSKK